jgi:SAM-dependent methyltransferase
MAQFVVDYVKPKSLVLDVGSYDVNGTYKPLFEHCSYVGLDIEAGPNVDVVSQDHYSYPFPDASFDVVISGQCLEHSYYPWKIIKEMGRMVKSNGMTCIIAPWQYEIHRHPVDCFRILPDGMTRMMEDAGFKVLSCITNKNDCCGIGTK